MLGHLRIRIVEPRGDTDGRSHRGIGLGLVSKKAGPSEANLWVGCPPSTPLGNARPVPLIEPRSAGHSALGCCRLGRRPEACHEFRDCLCFGTSRGGRLRPLLASALAPSPHGDVRVRRHQILYMSIRHVFDIARWTERKVVLL
jgi:hypothetical protein